MKDKPILFSAPMVRAILAGTKTQTRRVIKPQPVEFELMKSCAGIPQLLIDRCPYGASGTKLWVRETFAQIYNNDGCVHSEPYDTIKCSECKDCHIEYRSDTDNKHPGEWPDDFDADAECPKWKPSIFMPRWASRITLEIVNIRVERLQNISEEDAKAEGITVEAGHMFKPFGDNGETKPYTHKQAYSALWDSINGESAWNKNPFCWVIEFVKIKIH
jgi:hypothetical protein